VASKENQPLPVRSPSLPAPRAAELPTTLATSAQSQALIPSAPAGAKLGKRSAPYQLVCSYTTLRKGVPKVRPGPSNRGRSP
jgi:hypothetical protein